MLSRVNDLLTYDTPEEDQKEAEDFFTETLRAHEAAEKTWKDRTINDRIDAAFAALSASGIVALQWAGDTQSAGWENAREARTDWQRGVVFYHGQDLERVLDGGSLMLAFGAFDNPDDDDEMNAAIGREVCQALQKEGIETEWDGSGNRRIAIPNFPWCKRRHTSPPDAR